jgi:hypothetical protein
VINFVIIIPFKKVKEAAFKIGNLRTTESIQRTIGEKFGKVISFHYIFCCRDKKNTGSIVISDKCSPVNSCIYSIMQSVTCCLYNLVLKIAPKVKRDKLGGPQEILNEEDNSTYYRPFKQQSKASTHYKMVFET